MESICKFVPPSVTGESIQTVNFVYETRHSHLPPVSHRAVYSVHLVTSGSAVVLQGGRVETVGPGDLYFLFPAVESRVDGDGEFRYLYISFFGIRAAYELERLGITASSFAFPGMAELEPFWRSALEMSHETVTLASESVLLFTLARIGDGGSSAPLSAALPGTENARLLKEFVDQNFADPDLNAERLSRRFSYHKKYISTLFKKHYRVGVVEYIRSVRLAHACRLLEEGTLSVSQVAEASGFRDALYFSRVFKKIVGLSPRAYREKKETE